MSTLGGNELVIGAGGRGVRGLVPGDEGWRLESGNWRVELGGSGSGSGGAGGVSTVGIASGVPTWGKLSGAASSNPQFWQYVSPDRLVKPQVGQGMDAWGSGMGDCGPGIGGGGLATGNCWLVINSMPQFGQNTADGGGMSPQLGQAEGALATAGGGLGVDDGEGRCSGLAAAGRGGLINSIPQF